MSRNKRSVLVVEDDAAIRRGLVDSLRFAGYEVLEAADGRQGRRMILAASFDLCLLDVMLPQVDGFELLEELRRCHPRLPVIMLTARGEEAERVRGLRSGADDYVVKPFSSSELLARVEAVLRRSAERPADLRSLRLDGWIVDLLRARIETPTGQQRPLTEREAQLLRYLAISRERVVTREELLQHVWGLDPRGIETRTVDMHVARLREKLDDKSANRFLSTVRSRGYMLGRDVEVEAS